MRERPPNSRTDRGAVGRLHRRRVGLALGGGAAFGGMHVGVLMALHDGGIAADIVAGTSAGAFVGAFYAGGLSPRDMGVLSERLRWHQLRRHLLPVRALMSNERMGAWLERHLPVTEFGAMPRTFAVVATDISSGAMVVLCAEDNQRRILDGAIAASVSTSGREYAIGEVSWQTARVPVAVRASSAIPVIFEPVRIGDRYLVDGGVASMVPATVAHWLGADVVIAVDILPPRQESVAPRTILEYAIQAHRIGAQWAVRNRSIRADVVIRPRALGGAWNDMRQMRELIRIGYAEGEAALPAIRRCLGAPVEAAAVAEERTVGV